jgi:hypothetical protein
MWALLSQSIGMTTRGVCLTILSIGHVVLDLRMLVFLSCSSVILLETIPITAEDVNPRTKTQAVPTIVATH